MANYIEPKSINDLHGMKFFIPSYQRGYRWTEQQVKDLLNDILEFSQKKKQESEYYCLQPLVVKRKDKDVLSSIKAATSIEEVETLLKGSWEVIDGQQRLTTLFIILSVLGETSVYLYYHFDCQSRQNHALNYHVYYQNQNHQQYHSILSFHLELCL